MLKSARYDPPVTRRYEPFIASRDKPGKQTSALRFVGLGRFSHVTLSQDPCVWFPVAV
jgi:hypothetical protein